MDKVIALDPQSRTVTVRGRTSATASWLRISMSKGLRFTISRPFRTFRSPAPAPPPPTARAKRTATWPPQVSALELITAAGEIW